MELSQFLHTETRKCSWFAHWWMEGHRRNPVVFPLNLSGQRWVDEYRAWEEFGCPNPKNPDVFHWYVNNA